MFGSYRARPMRARPTLRAVPIVAAIAVLAALVVIGLGGVAASSGAQRAPESACGAHAGSTVRVSVEVTGEGRRSALVHLPKRRRAHMPLVVVLHGAYGNGAFMERYSGLSRVADREGFGAVYPDAVGPRWRISQAEGAADVQFLDALLDRVLAGGCFDDERVSAVGVSNGAGMAARFACAGDDRLAGLVAVAGGYGTLPSCQARRPLSVLEIHGTADAVVPYHGTPKLPAGDVLQWLKEWTDLDACPRPPRQSPERPRVERLDWAGCSEGTEVAHLRLDGGTHAWPGADPPDPGPRLGVSAADEAWNFLRGRRLSPAVADRHQD
jgi:polyhydroxybutyrate depolymerase